MSIPPYINFNIYATELELASSRPVFIIEGFEKAREGWWPATMVEGYEWQKMAQYVAENRIPTPVFNTENWRLVMSEEPKASSRKFGFYPFNAEGEVSAMFVRPLTTFEMRLLTVELNKVLSGQ